jgi:hypothetical protein
MAQASTAAAPEAREAIRRDSARSLTRRTAVGTAAAVVLAFVTRSVALGVNPDLAALDPFGIGPIAGSAVAAGVGAAVVYAGAVRYTARPVRTFLAAAAAVFVLMLLPVAFVSPELGVGTGGQLWLVVLHAAVAVPLVLAVVRLGPGGPAGA